MCTCSVPTSQATSYGSNFECCYATTTCQLITGLDDMSYGNQPCADCTRDVQCVMQDGTGVGTCGCMFQALATQQCSQPPGQFVPLTSPNNMCCYLAHEDKSQPLTAVHWDNLVLVQCMYLNPTYRDV